MINRVVLILKYKQPAVDWINEADPYYDYPGITPEEANKDRTIYLIGAEHADTPDALQVWITSNVEFLFENELMGWYQDKSFWPKPLDYELFQSWFEVECHTIVIDTCDNAILDDE